MHAKANLDSVHLPDLENELSSRYLRIILRWIPIARKVYSDWPVRPNCGHFFGGVYWYGNQTGNSVLSLAAAASSPEYDEKLATISAQEARQMALRGLRYLLFTHDSGPEDCVRPTEHWGRPECAGTKWGERGKGFFRESQCGRTVGHIAATAALIRDLLGDEELEMLANLAHDYIDRFSAMDPKSGVYNDTQTEENAWTAWGLASSLLLLAETDTSAESWFRTKMWMFRTVVTPQDNQDTTAFGDEGEVRRWGGRVITTFPELTAENHGFVHPSYMASSIALGGDNLVTLRLFGAEAPAQLHWRRRDVIGMLNKWTDGTGSPHCPQGMDWPYTNLLGNAHRHAMANCFYGNPDSALLERRALALAEKASVANGGAIIPESIEKNCRNVQDEMVFWNHHMDISALAYLAHRLTGPGVAPSTEEQLTGSAAGAHYYPSAGILLHNHGQGITSFSWRNRTMILPAPSEGIRLVGPAEGSILGSYDVAGTGKSSRTERIVIREQLDRCSALLIEDLHANSIRRQVFFCSLPDGKGISYETSWATANINLEACRLGYLRIVNEPTYAENPVRRHHWDGGSHESVGTPTANPQDDVRISLGKSAWFNADDRMGFVFQGTGRSVLVDKHHFQPYHAVHDEMILAENAGPRSYKAGEQTAELALLWCPEQDHAATQRQQFRVLEHSRELFAAEVDGWLCACNFTGAKHEACGVLLEPMEPRVVRL